MQMHEAVPTSDASATTRSLVTVLPTPGPRRGAGVLSERPSQAPEVKPKVKCV